MKIDVRMMGVGGDERMAGEREGKERKWRKDR